MPVTKAWLITAFVRWPPETVRTSLASVVERNASISCFVWYNDGSLPCRRSIDIANILWHHVRVATLIPDTHRLITQLCERGFTADQAGALTEAFQDFDLSELATKGDINELKHQLREVELRITLKLGGLIAAGVGFLAFLKFFG